jgi:hypothetical protein
VVAARDPAELAFHVARAPERYLGVEQDLRDAPCDHLDLLP